MKEKNDDDGDSDGDGDGEEGRTKERKYESTREIHL